jgi:hypothetical protein
MRPNTLKPLRVVIAAMLLTAAPAALSAMYRWVDEQGTVTYSNEPPPASARDVTLVDDITNSISSHEKRTRELLLEAERDKSGTSTANPAAGAVASQPATASGDLPAPRAAISPGQPEAVRDPCLRSADPKCYERNRASYVPYRGYSPSAAGASATAAVGATSSAAAGGTVAGGAPPAPAKLTAPKASVYALPPGSDTGAAPLPASTGKR